MTSRQKRIKPKRNPTCISDLYKNLAQDMSSELAKVKDKVKKSEKVTTVWFEQANARIQHLHTSFGKQMAEGLLLKDREDYADLSKHVNQIGVEINAHLLRYEQDVIAEIHHRLDNRD